MLSLKIEWNLLKRSRNKNFICWICWDCWSMIKNEYSKRKKQWIFFIWRIRFIWIMFNSLLELQIDLPFFSCSTWSMNIRFRILFKSSSCIEIIDQTSGSEVRITKSTFGISKSRSETSVVIHKRMFLLKIFDFSWRSNNNIWTFF